jgi:hypothetical protein
MELKKLAATYTNCRFGVLTDDSVAAIRAFKLREFPAKIAFRQGKQIPVNLEQIAAPLFVRMRQKYLKDFCAEKCLLYIGKPTPDLIENYTGFTEMGIAFIETDSGFARSLAIGENKWALLSGVTGTYAGIDIGKVYKEIASFTSKKAKRADLSREVDWVFDDFVEAARGMVGKLNPAPLFAWVGDKLGGLDSYTLIIVLMIFVPTVMRVLHIVR